MSKEKTIDDNGIVRYDSRVSIRESIIEIDKIHAARRADLLYGALVDEFYYQGMSR